MRESYPKNRVGKDLLHIRMLRYLFRVLRRILFSAWLLLLAQAAAACPACRGNVDVLKEFAKVEQAILQAEKQEKLQAIKPGRPSKPIVDLWAGKEAAGGMHSGALFAHLILSDTQQRLELKFKDGSARVSPATEVQPEVLFITSLSTLEAVNRGKITLDDAIAEGWFVTIDPALTSGDRP